MPNVQKLFVGLALAAAAASCMSQPARELALSDMVPQRDAAAAAEPAAIVYFDIGSAVLMADGIAVLDQLVNDPGRPRWTKVMLSGYADRSGSARLNRRLSAARVEAVRRYLVNAGVPAAVVATEAVGTRLARRGVEAEDRRVEIFVTS